MGPGEMQGVNNREPLSYLSAIRLGPVSQLPATSPPLCGDRSAQPTCTCLTDMSPVRSVLSNRLLCVLLPTFISLPLQNGFSTMGIPHFSKVHVTPRNFTKDLLQYLFSITERNLKIFALVKKSEK